MAEGAPLLREYRVCSPIEGSNPSFSAIIWQILFYGRVAQLDRVPGYEPGGRRFESFRARHIHKALSYKDKAFYFLSTPNFILIDKGKSDVAVEYFGLS